MAEQEEKTSGSSQSRRNVIIGAGVVVLAGAAGAYYFSGKEPEQTAGQVSDASQGSGKDAALLQAGPLGEMVLGDPNAPVTIIEYASMTCSHCANFHRNTLPGLKSKYIDTGKARLILREFPFDDLAVAAFMLARCAGEGKYFPLVDELFARQKEWTSGGDPTDSLFRIVRPAGFTKESFQSCISDQKMLEGINWVRERGHEKFGVDSTPTFFVNGQILKGARSLVEFEEVLEPLLKGNS